MESGIQEMHKVLELLIYLSAFGIVAVAARKLAGVFQKFKLPLISGFLVIGIISGPEVLGLIEPETLNGLNFLNDVALAFIAFAVGSELYLNELRSRMKSIIAMTISQVVVTFLLMSLAMYLLMDVIPLFSGMKLGPRISISMLAGVVAIARSPASAIAVINELRARGPFTQTSIGVTVVKDFGVVIFFAIMFTLSKSLIQEAEFRMIYIVQVLVELIVAFGLGFLVWLILRLVLKIKGMLPLKKLLVLLSGFMVYMFTHVTADHSNQYLGMELHIEPLLTCIIASFLVTNFSVYRNDFVKIVKELGPYVYVVFFTLTGAMVSLSVVAALWFVTLILFGARVISLILAGYLGSSFAGDPPLFRRISWMPYVTQAGVGVGLATIIASEYPGWGGVFATVMISVIVLNQIVGPPLFKWALHLAGEAHVKSDGTVDTERKILIFGWESQSIALARQLQKQKWNVEFVVPDPAADVLGNKDYIVHEYLGPGHLDLRKFSAETADTLVCLLSDEENYAICETAYEHFGTKHLITRLHEREYYKKFMKIDVMVVDPNSAMVSLLEHFIRAPIATSLLLGMDETQDSIDIELRNSDFHGLTLRDLRLPADVIILSVTRGDHPIISHGYTRLRLGDIVTMVGSNMSLDKVRLNLQGY
ncbi:MAG: potassium transporter TrkA [Bacteroidetes bacterium]|nr:potassium transporter TrkA [Bacteroidota bacterium]